MSQGHAEKRGLFYFPQSLGHAKGLKMIEYKTVLSPTKSIEDRTVIGIPVVHGNIDDSGDRSHPGSFADITGGGRNRTRFLWQHNGNEPPIAKINYVREIPRSELPQKVISYAPDASGGVEISRTYLKSTRANDVLEGLIEGAIEEMSYAYEVTKKDSTEENGQTIRELYGVKTFDFSDVNWGLNNATATVKAGFNPFTLGSKSWTGTSLTFTDHSEAVVSIVEEFSKRAKERQDFRQKEGRVLSTATRSRITQLLESLKAVSLDLDTLLRETEPKADPATTRALFIEFQRLQAQLNGAMNYAN